MTPLKTPPVLQAGSHAVSSFHSDSDNNLAWNVDVYIVNSERS